MTNLRRQQFEAHMRTLKSYSLFRHGEEYVDADTQVKWELWQVAWDAALASQESDLRKEDTPQVAPCSGGHVPVRGNDGGTYCDECGQELK